jgi:RNA polymerase sigma-70 factor (ECF subfamily)
MLTLNRMQARWSDPGESDIALVAEAIDDPRSFELLFDRYWEPVLRYCLVRLDDWQLAEDAASQTFIKMHAHLQRFVGTDDSAFRCWMFAIARNTVHDVQRATYRHRSTRLAEAESLADSGISPEDAALQSEQSRQLRQLLSTLPDEHRQLIELRAAGLTAAEIGVVLGKSEAAVRQAQSRLIRSLRSQFAEGPEAGDVHV